MKNKRSMVLPARAAIVRAARAGSTMLRSTMGRKSINKQRIEDPQTKAIWLRQLMPLLVGGGLHGETMVTIAQKVGVSKATFYKHYDSKEALLADAVDLKIEQIARFAILLFDKNESYLKRYDNALQNVSGELAEISNDFLMYLKVRHPDLWQKIDTLVDFGTQSFRDFYEQGIEENILENFDVHMMALTDSIVIHSLTNPHILIENNITIAAFIEQYFQMKSKAIFKG